MENHWEASLEWDRATEGDTEEQAQHIITAPGSFHCKSALRSHDSNMKLYLYRKSFTHLKSLTGSSPYTEDSLLLLPDLWNCFYNKTHGLDRVFDINKSRTHSTGSLSLIRWANTTLGSILDGDILADSIRNEAHIWQCNFEWIKSFDTTIYPTIIDKFKSLLYLVYFLNLSLVVLNHRDNNKRPDINVKLSGIVYEEDEDLYKMVYNDYLTMFIYKDCVRVVTPIFDQILQKDLYLNLCDKVNERLNVLLGSHIISYAACHQPNDPLNYDIHLNRAVHQIIDWGDNLLYKHKNHAYSLIGKYEAYCVSAIIKRDDPKIWKNDEFQQNLLADDRDSQIELYEDAKILCRLLDDMHEAVLAEVHGLWRIWGHPIIDLEGGLRKMEATCTKKHNISKRETRIGERTFKLTFSKNYYSKHKHYPLSNMTEQTMFDGYSTHLMERDMEDYNNFRHLYNATSYIHKCLRRNQLINEKNSDYVHSDWDDVHLLQSFQIPQSINLATMIKDKAISQTRSELIESVTLRNSVFDPKKRRGVLKWLSEQTIRLKDYLHTIDALGLAEDDRIIGLYPKERELKPKARFFSLMSYNMRMYITATEEILGKYLLPYFPMITMSDTLLSMLIRLFNMTTQIGVSGSKVTYSMNIDFSKWNQNMREATNDGIFTNIDRIIGFRRLISRTHDIFRNSYLYLCSGEYVPTIIRRMLTTISPYSRIGDESGKEGLRQKGWTITTVCDILSLAFLHNVKIELIGGGDNQVLTVEIHSQGKNLLLSEGEQLVKIQERMNRFRNALAKKMEKRGLPLKLEETWISHRLLMYNKIMYLSGVPLPGRLKVISRMFSNSNEGILTLGNITSTLGTGFQSLSSKDYDPVLAWIMSRLMTLISLGQYYLSNPVCGTRRLDQQILKTKANLKNGVSHFGDKDEYWRPKKQSIIKSTSDHSLSFVELYMVCLYYHKVLGGPGIGTPLSYIMKGFPDPVSESLAFNYSIIKVSPSRPYSTIVSNLTSVQASDVMHWEHLLEDPVSINHNAPAHGVAALREQAETILRQAEIRNVKFKELISLGDTEYLRGLSEQLCKPAELEPRLLHDIVGSTIPGYVNTILSKVDQSSTLSKLATSADVVTSVYTSEIEYYIFLADKVHTKVGHTPGSCPTEDARALRNHTWRRKIIGVTTPHPMSFLLHMDHHLNSPTCDHNYITVLVKRSSSRYRMQRGEFRPYFGSYTQEKFKSGILSSAYGDEDILKRSLKIQKLLGWRFKSGTTMYNIIQGILRCVTNSDPNKFLPTPEEITGDVEHRYHDMATKHGGIPSNLIKYYTHVSCNTSTFIDHSKGAANESLHFQAAIIYCCMVSILKTLNMPNTTKILHFHESCRSCIKPIILSDNDGSALGDIKLISCPANELMYIEEKDIPVHFHSHIAFIRDQEKQRIALPANEDYVLFAEPKERISWLVLVCASFLNPNCSMKRSAIKLVISSLTPQECVYIIKSIAIVSLLQERRPWGQINAGSYTDIYMNHKLIFDMILNSTIMADFLYSIGVIPEFDLTKVGGFLMLVHETVTDVLDTETLTAVAKYQDPEFKYSRVLICSKLNPSLKTCPVCVINLEDTMKNNNQPLCSIHGPLNMTMRYHLYSLDKLSRYKGPPCDNAVVSLGGSTGKRKNRSLLECLQYAQDSSQTRSAKRRKSGFLFSSSKKETHIIKLMNLLWTSQQISVDGYDKTDTPAIGEGMKVYIPQADVIPSHICDVVNISTSLFQILTDHASKNRIDLHGDPRDLHIALELFPNGKDYMVLSKALSLMDRAVEAYCTCSLIIHMFCSVEDSIEDVDLRYIEMLVSTYKSMSNSIHHRIRFGVTDDNCLDIVWVVANKDIVVARSCASISYIASDYYYMSASDKVYEGISKIDTENKRLEKNYEVQLSFPTMTASSPFPAVVFAKRMNGYHQISDALLISSLSGGLPQWCSEDCSAIVSTFGTVEGVSIYQELYKSLVTIKSGITDRASYDSIISKLAGGLYNFALQASQTVKLPWRCVSIIRLILCIKILTDNDTAGALEYYSLCNSVSFKQGTYKIIQLHRGAVKAKDKRGLVNWTSGTFGSLLSEAVEDTKRWLYITWSEDHVRIPVLVL